MSLTDDELTQLVADMSVSDTPVIDATRRPRKAIKRAAGRTGRSAFVNPICDAHPDWETDDGTVIYATEETHCAKFGHLPGRGRGVYQPPFYRGILSVFTEMAKPILLIGLLLGGFFVLKLTVLDGGFLQSGKPVCRTTGAVSDSVGNKATNANPADSKLPNARTCKPVRDVRTSTVSK